MRTARCATAVVVAFLTPAGLSAQPTKRIYALVVDRARAPITDLKPAEFVIKEDGVARTVTRVSPANEPMRIVLDVDSSQVVGQSLTSIRAGLQAFLDELPADHEIGFVSTGGQSRVRVAPTLDRNRLRKEASGFFADGGGAA